MNMVLTYELVEIPVVSTNFAISKPNIKEIIRTTNKQLEPTVIVEVKRNICTMEGLSGNADSKIILQIFNIFVLTYLFYIEKSFLYSPSD